MSNLPSQEAVDDWLDLVSKKTVLNPICIMTEPVLVPLGKGIITPIIMKMNKNNENK